MEFTYNESPDTDVDSVESLLYTDFPECDIKIQRDGRIVFSPKGESKPIALADMHMPPKEFWEAISTLIHSMDIESADLRRKLAIEKAKNLVMDDELGKINTRPIIVNGGNDKRKFFAGVVVGSKLNKR